jgi:hypothetical protein
MFADGPSVVASSMQEALREDRLHSSFALSHSSREVARRSSSFSFLLLLLAAKRLPNATRPPIARDSGLPQVQG